MRKLAMALLMLAAAAPTPPEQEARPGKPVATAGKPAAHRHRARHRRAPAVTPGRVTAPAPRPPDAARLAPAPLPNRDAAPPPAPPQSGAQVSGERLQIHYPAIGDGYLPGSSSVVIDNARAARVPGVQVRIPVSQDPAPAPP